MLFIYANYYYNFGFNVTCIKNEENLFNQNDKSLLKSPSHEWRIFQYERQNLETLHSYDWNNAVGIGTVLGYNNLRALDIDNCENYTLIKGILKTLNLPIDYEWVVKSGSKKGFHIIFYGSDHQFKTQRDKIKALKPNSKFIGEFKHIELRWIGHLVLPPSIHSSYYSYEFVNKQFPQKPPLTIEDYNLYLVLVQYCYYTIKSLRNLVQWNTTDTTFIESEDFKESKESSFSYLDLIPQENFPAKEEDTFPPESDINLEPLLSNGDIYHNEEEYLESESKEGDYSHINSDESQGAYFPFPSIKSISSKRDNNFYLFFDTETTGVPNNWDAPASQIENWPRLIQLA
jgi:hypothetical protein